MARNLLAIQKAILPLNIVLSRSLTSIWMTTEELHERIVLAGINGALKPAVVVNTLRLHNPDEYFIAKRVHSSDNYYR